MPWTEISKGQFQRQIGENETFIKLIGDSGAPLGREHWAINADAAFKRDPNISEDDFVQHLKTAWQTLRFHHPSIAAIASGTQIHYTVPDQQELQKWLSETFVLHKDETREEVAAAHKPTLYVVLHYFPAQSEILMHTSHWRTDGIGILQLMNAFLDLVGSESSLPDLNNLPWGEETARLAPCVEDAADIPAEATEEIKAEAEKWTKTFHEAVGAVGIEFTPAKNGLPGGTRCARDSFSESTTEAIVAACKTQSISVTSAIHAALAETNWAFAAPEDRSKHWLSTIRAGLRPYLPEPYSTPAYASGLYTSGYMHSLQAGQSFAQNAKQINELYRAGLSPEFLEAHRQYALNLTELIKNTPPDAPPGSGVDISSLGLVEKMLGPKHGSLEVLNVNVGVEVLTPQMTLFVWTFRGRLAMNLVYNEAFYEVERPVKFLESLKKTLLKELDIQS